MQFGTAFNGKMVINTDGYRLVTGAAPAGELTRVSPVPVPRQYQVTVNNPEFYLMILRAKLCGDNVFLDIRPEAGELEVIGAPEFSDCQDIYYSETLQIPETNAPGILVGFQARYILEALGSWPFTLSWSEKHPAFMFSFQDPAFDYLVMPLKEVAENVRKLAA